MTGARRRTVLLVDDDPAWREVLGGWLEAEGLRVVRLTRGEWVTHVIETHRADAVVLDLHLPGVDGLQLVERIRRRWPTLPVVLTSSFGGPDIAAQARQAGATAYFDRPMPLDDLLRELKRIVVSDADAQATP